MAFFYALVWYLDSISLVSRSNERLLLLLIHWLSLAFFVLLKQRSSAEKSSAATDAVHKIVSKFRHDLASPTMVIISSLQLMRKKEREGKLDTEERGRVLDRVLANAEKLGNMVEEFQSETRKIFPARK